MEVHVRLLSGSVHIFTVESDWTIHHLKLAIELKLGASRSEQRLLLDGAEPHKTASLHSLTNNGCVLVLDLIVSLEVSERDA